MRKIIIQEMVTVDGFFAGPEGQIDWHVVDAEFNEHAIAMLESVDTIFFGRATYDMMASYWPSEDVIKDDPIVAGKMNSLTKIVFSKTADKLEWNNTASMQTIDAAEIAKMKQASGKDMVILGSGTIVSQFTELGLIDEYHLIINPVVIGAGKTLFAGVKGKIKLKLLGTKQFASGNVLLRYGRAQ